MAVSYFSSQQRMQAFGLTNIRILCEGQGPVVLFIYLSDINFETIALSGLYFLILESVHPWAKFQIKLVDL